LHENSEYIQWYIHQTRQYISREGTPSIEVVNLLKNFDKLLLLLFIIISNLVIINFQYYPAHHHHQSHVELNLPPVHVSGYMPQHHQSHAQSIYQSVGFS